MVDVGQWGHGQVPKGERIEEWEGNNGKLILAGGYSSKTRSDYVASFSYFLSSHLLVQKRTWYATSSVKLEQRSITCTTTTIITTTVHHTSHYGV